MIQVTKESKHQTLNRPQVKLPKAKKVAPATCNSTKQIASNVSKKPKAKAK